MDLDLNDNAASIADVSKFFGGNLAAFRKEWSALTPADKAQIRNGIGDGSLTY